MTTPHSQKPPQQPSTPPNGDPERKGPIDPKEQAIKYKAFRHIFTEKEIAKGLDEKAIVKKIRRSKTLAGRYQQYVEMVEEEGLGNKHLYPWHNPFNHFLFWIAYWTPKAAKWGSLALLILLAINYIPGPTQHILEVVFARAIYDTAPVDRLPDDLENYAHSARIVDAGGAVIKSYGKRQVTQPIPAKAQKAILACEDHYLLPHPNNPWYVNAFLIHPGVSWPNLFGAVLDVFRGQTRGASTIVMQNAKKIVGNTDRTIANKLEEIILSYMMVSKFGKEKNLNFYANTVPVGANIYGFPEAAASYFKKPLAELNYQQLVAVGSFIPNHNRQIAFYEIIRGRNLEQLDPTLARHAREAMAKVNLALTYLRKLNEISEEEYRAWYLRDEDTIRRIGFRDFRSPLYGEEEWTSWNVIKEVSSRTYRINGRDVPGTQLILDERGDVVIETAVDLSLVEKIKASIATYLASPGYREALRRSNAGMWQRDQEQYQVRKLEPPYTDFDSYMEFLFQHLNVGVVAVNQKGEVVAYVGGK
ncbi:MAG TPA: biosynthetic peptidoglycan transglycosylase, partial [Desulfurivibrionaceae bacterium]|nr:biosynthetic peptidoglycan transglycosylase [Desulfurivibrionaceae bacterium]